MNESDYNELLNRAKSLMDERDASIPPVAMPGDISMRGRTLSYDSGEGAEDSTSGILGRYPGDLVLSSRKVRITPFGVFVNGNLDSFMVPTINEESIFEDNPPTLDRRPDGAAVYIESVFELSDRGTPSTGETDPPYKAKLIRCNIVDRPLGDPYPIEKAVVSLILPDDTWALVSETAKAYRLLGVYTETGHVYNQTIIGGNTSDWTYRTTTLEDGRILPPSRPAAMRAPIKYEITLNY